MIRPSPSHRLLNLVQTMLILGGMAAIAWVVLGSIFGPEVTVLLIALSLAGLALAQSLSREFLLRGYRARPLGPREWPEGVAVLHELARRAGLPRPPELWYVPSQVPNAFAMGPPEESAVCVSDALLRLLTPRELAAVLAHEVAHIANRDLWLMGLADAMSRAVSVASWLGQFLLIINLPLMAAGAATFPWGALLLLVFSPTIMALLQLSLSRRREYDADLGAVELTGDPEALASALTKLERLAGRFWEEIFLPGRRIPEPSLLRTHPPTEVRVARLRALAPRRKMPALSPPRAAPPAGLQIPPPPGFRRSGYWF